MKNTKLKEKMIEAGWTHQKLADFLGLKEDRLLDILAGGLTEEREKEIIDLIDLCVKYSVGKHEKPGDIRLPEAVAVDFDGTICKNRWPNIGDPNWDLIKWLIWRREHGWRLILWTNRDGDKLDEAVAACAEWGLEFDAINNNLPERIALYGNNSRKVSADYYIDDHNAFLKGVSLSPIALMP